MVPSPQPAVIGSTSSATAVRMDQVPEGAGPVLPLCDWHGGNVHAAIGIPPTRHSGGVENSPQNIQVRLLGSGRVSCSFPWVCFPQERSLHAAPLDRAGHALSVQTEPRSERKGSPLQKPHHPPLGLHSCGRSGPAKERCFCAALLCV